MEGCNVTYAVEPTDAAGISRHKLCRSGKVECYQRNLAEELLYACLFTSEAERARAIGIWNIHYNYYRPHTAAGNQPPALKLGPGVTNALRARTPSERAAHRRR